MAAWLYNISMMSTSLVHCPACNAPLVPKGSASLIHCQYCGTPVVVPEELRQVSGAADWSTLVFDSFNANDHNWLVGSRPSEYFTKLNQTIADGRYRWEAQVNRPSSMTTAWLMGYSLSRYHLIVNGKHIHGSRAGSAWGMVFHIQDSQNYYWFRISDTQSFAISLIRDGQWLNLVDWTRSEALKPRGVNQLEIIASDMAFTFLLNRQVVSEIENDHFRKGLVGLAIEGYGAGEETTVDFLDFILRAP